MKDTDRARATAGALIGLSTGPSDSEQVQERAMQQWLVLVSLGLLAASLSLLAVRSGRNHRVTAPIVSSSTTLSIPLVPPPATTTTLRPTEAVGCPQVAFGPLDEKRATSCLYLAWKSGDQKGTQFYASVSAVETLFSRPWTPPDLVFQGCQPAPGPTTALPHQTCRYDAVAMDVECESNLGCSVVTVTFVG